MRWLVVAALVLAVGCKKQQDEPRGSPVRAIPEAELTRGRDACKAYVEQVCACAETVEAAKQLCQDSRALADAIEVAVGVSSSPDSTTKDTLHASSAVRNVIAECIQGTAKLPTLGCPTVAPK